MVANLAVKDVPAARRSRRFGRLILGSVLAMCVACLAQGQASEAASTAPKPDTAQKRPTLLQRPVEGANFVIGADDTVTIVATKAEEISKPWRVGVSGYLNLPLVGRIYVLGLTEEQLEAELLTRLGKYINEPQVTVYVSEFHSMPVMVTGAVEKPGVTQMQGSKTLFDVLLRAGGPKNAGELVTVTRRLDKGRLAHPDAKDEEGSSVVELPLAAVMEGRGTASDLVIQTGDVITVSDVKQKRMVYLVGAVVKPGLIELVTQDKVSLLAALGAAGGVTTTAASGKAFIRHTGADKDGDRAIPVDVGQILKGKQPDVDLIAGDIVVVPTSKMASLMQVLPQSLLTSGLLLLTRF